MVNKIGLQSIFPVPIYTTFIDKNLSNQIENLIIPRLDSLQFTDEQYSDYFLPKKLVTASEINDLLYQIDIFTNKFSEETGIIKFKVGQYWVQDYKKGNSHHRHAHGGDVISCVYYVRANENAGKLRLINPNPFSTITQLKTNTTKHLHYDITPQKGLLVIFPGWLMHEVIPSQHPNCIRTCIALNFGRG